MAREMIRQGGRSARIQMAVHKTVNELLQTRDRADITVPMIAEQAGVTPSTIYRRWGDLSQLLADVAVAHMRPISDPDDTGAMRSDVETFILQYSEEMSSKVGRQMLTDVLGSSGTEASDKCCGFSYQHLDLINQRALSRGEAGFDVNDAIDFLISPLMYHILFADREVSPEYCLSLIARFFHSTH